MNNDTKRTYKQFNLQKYFVEVKLYNSDSEVMTLNPESMLHLVIEDDMHFWPIRGFFIYENPYEIFERKMNSNDEINNADLEASVRATLKAHKPYTFRNDGKDYLDITIRPELDENSDLPIKTLDPKIWELKFNCVIYDKEDIESPDITKKLKKFYFWDRDYQKMLEKHPQWSTATSEMNDARRSKGNAYIPSQATDDERKMYTGDAIQSLLLANGFNINSSNFDRGSSKLFYSTFQDKDIWDNIDYILKHHISTSTTAQEPINESDICIFDKDRYDQSFELVPINKIFKKAGNDVDIPLEYQLEHLFFDETGTPSNSPYKAPFLNKSTTDKDVKITKIKKYQFVDMAGSDSTNIIKTTPVHTYDYKNKTFSISMANSNVQTLETKIKELYIKNNLLSKNGTHPILTLNQNKITNDIVDPVFCVRSNKSAVTKAGLGRLLYASLFFNECLAFQVDGATIRRSGRFVGIDRQTNSDNTLDYKLCGQWFVTNVKHVFFHNMYSNEVIAVKIHSYDDLNIKQDV